MQYLSMWVSAFRALKSCTSRILPFFLATAKILGYREDPGWLNHSKFEPFNNVFFYFLHVRVQNLELFDKDRFFCP